MQSNSTYKDIHTDKFLKTVRPPMMSYEQFIIRDPIRKQHQVECLGRLQKLQNYYYNNGISDMVKADKTEYSKKNSVDWAFELYLMKKHILLKSQNSKKVDFVDKFKFNKNVMPLLTKQANQVFLLAMLKGNINIVSFFLNSRLINVNQCIFEGIGWPSYYIFACSCDESVIYEFRKYWINTEISWNGITGSMLIAVNNSVKNSVNNSKNIVGNNKNFYFDIDKVSCLDFMTYEQYYLLNLYRGVVLRKSKTQLPVFLLDFACMVSNRVLIKRILDNMPEIGSLSRLSFIVQNEEHIILILSRYGFSADQSFNGITPLHISCYNNDFCTFSILLYIGFPIRKDSSGHLPNEVGGIKMRERASIFFNITTKIVKDSSGKISTNRVFSRPAFINNMESWLGILKYNPLEFDKYIGMFKYLDFNRENRIYKKSRFNIINVFSLSKSAASVERMIKKLMLITENINKYDDELRDNIQNNFKSGNYDYNWDEIYRKLYKI